MFSSVPTRLRCHLAHIFAPPVSTQSSEGRGLWNEWRLLNRSSKVFAAKAATVASIGGLLFGYDIGVCACSALFSLSSCAFLLAFICFAVPSVQEEF